jgi:B12-binding domain/radical SAM domain protein
MAKVALAFIVNRMNANSVAALAGLVEAHPALGDVDLAFLSQNTHLPVRLREVLDAYARVVVACSFCTPAATDMRHVLSQLHAVANESYSAVTWIAGGPHPSGSPEATLRMGFDVVVVGEGEQMLPFLLSHLLEGSSYHGYDGLVYLEGGHPVHTGRVPWVSSLDAYPPFALRHRRFAPIEIMRGCPFACRFCQTSFLFGGIPRYRSPEVVAEWTRVARACGVPLMRFIAPNALSYGSPSGRELNLAAVEELLLKVGAAMGREHVYLGAFPSEVRPEMVTDEAIQLIKRLTANKSITIGGQAGSQRVLDSVHRGHQVEDIYHACHVVLKYGLVPDVDIIFGLPDETAQDRTLTIQLVANLTRLGARVHTHAFTPLAGTPLENAPPGQIDAPLDRLLGNLARTGQQHGERRRWRPPRVRV